tara:strand:+ start:947 stop:1564 length:618 start_codon:yes stop_codon:yes gene_type:complete
MWHSEQHGVIRTPKGITVNELQHPANIFRLWSKEELAKIGITPARVEVPDNRYYNTGAETLSLVNGETVISYESTERNVDDLKKGLISAIKQNVGSSLSSSDWRVIREADGGTAMSDAWKTYRSEVRTHGNSLESGVEAFASLDAVKNFQNHLVVEVRYKSTYDAEGKETIGPETEDHNRTVDKTHWGWPVAPDAEVDPYHVEYK